MTERVGHDCVMTPAAITGGVHLLKPDGQQSPALRPLHSHSTNLLVEGTGFDSILG
jgi:hypothetical protein